MAKMRKGKLILSNKDKDTQVSMDKRRVLDTRLDWRDPNMPVLREYRMANGTTRTVIDPDYERRYREMLMQSNNAIPYNRDPTYDLKRKRK